VTRLAERKNGPGKKV